MDKKDWRRGAFLYQIYPRSFYDANNDGTGDLRGITEKLDYVASLGVDGIWISPFFKSPMKDFGYDISDYKDVDPVFGTMANFDALLEKAHGLNLKIIIDLVLSHTSDEHPWFQESRSDKTNPKADWYVWADGKNGMPPNNWVSVFGGGAWEFDETRGQYYLHNFLKEQPDLNFHNAEVRAAVLDAAKFWLDKGVDGFRLDVVNFYFHDKELRDNPPQTDPSKFATQFEGRDPYSEQLHIYDKSQPENLAFLREFRKLCDGYGAILTVGEIGDDHPFARVLEYTSGDEFLNTCYNTAMMGGARKELTAQLIRAPLELAASRPQSWPTWAFSNHDVVRAASRWQSTESGGGDGFSHDQRLSKMLIALLGCLYGTVFLYQGEELGLPEARLEFKDLRDPWGIRLYPQWQGRDGCRTPMPWTGAVNGGFSKIKPWLPVPGAHMALSVAAQEKNANSVLNFTREFIAMRKASPALVSGGIEFLETGDDKILAFTRTLDKEAVSCVFNFADGLRKMRLGARDVLLDPYGFIISPVA